MEKMVEQVISNSVSKKSSIYHMYQPLYDISNRSLIGYEALLRHESVNPEQLFEMARMSKHLYELDTLSIYKAVKTFSLYNHTSHNSGLLFINVFPSTLTRSNFLEFINKLMFETRISPKQIVIEVNEIESIIDLDLLISTISQLHKMGFRIALDDVGKGRDALVDIIELELDYIKLDRFLSQELSLSEKKQRLVRVFADYCRGSNTQLILEGIEKEEDLAMAKLLGVPIGQGYLLGRPAALK